MSRNGTRLDTHPVVIVEDDNDDQLLLMKAFQTAQIRNPILFFKNGQEIFDYYGLGTTQGSYRRPAILLMDLDIPDVPGQELIHRFKRHSTLSMVPIIVFSGTLNPQDILQCYEFGANCFISKDGNIQSKVAVLINYWLETCQLPFECS